MIYCLEEKSICLALNPRKMTTHKEIELYRLIQLPQCSRSCDACRILSVASWYLELAHLEQADGTPGINFRRKAPVLACPPTVYSTRHTRILIGSYVYSNIPSNWSIKTIGESAVSAVRTLTPRPRAKSGVFKLQLAGELWKNV